MSAPNTRLQVMWNRLLAVVEEQGQALIRAAFSPIVRECGDISAGIFDFEGRMLAQAVTGTPGHINTMAEAVKTLRNRFAIKDMKPGDIYMTNDPWIASGHLNDFLLLMPVFYHGEVIGFTSCTSHLVDLGGLGMGPEGADIYDEGLLVPPCKLVSEHQVNALMMEIVKANSREPVANEGDIYALIACCEAGATRLTQMMEEFGLTDLDELSIYIIETSYRGTLDAIAELPKGTWHNVLKVDGYDQEIELCASLTIAEDHLALDFEGTAGCVAKGINVPLNYATAYSVFALRCIIGPDIPNNAGSLAPFRVSGPKGCILNAQPPAPVAMRHTLGQMTPASCMYDLPLRHVAEALDKGDETFAIELVFNGGTGARPSLDGLSATAFPSGVWGSQVETTEAVAPVIISARELRQGSGGAGVERILNPARGRQGGHDGAAGRVRIGRNGQNLPGKGELRIKAGETLVFETPGGGGFGLPSERSPEAVERDVENGLITAESAIAIYGSKT